MSANPGVHSASRRRRIAAISLAAIGAALLVPRRWLTVNDVTTGVAPAYPELAPHRYVETPDQTLQAARDSMRQMARWRIVREDAPERRIDAEIRVFLFGFTDDVTVWVEPEGTCSRVMIRSHSRIGKGDLGENARTIRALQAQMDRRLTRRTLGVRT